MTDESDTAVIRIALNSLIAFYKVIVLTKFTTANFINGVNQKQTLNEPLEN